MVLGGILVGLFTAVQREEHVDVFLAVALLSFTLLLKDPNDFTESLNGCPLALQVLGRKRDKSLFMYSSLQSHHNQSSVVVRQSEVKC